MSKYVQYLNAFFRDYVVERGLLILNPVAALKSPSSQVAGRKKKNQRFTKQEMDAIEVMVSEQSSSPDFALAVRFLRLTAARGGEMIQVMHREIDEHCIKIIPKGMIVQIENLVGQELLDARDEIEGRNFPYRMVPGVAELLDEIRTMRLPRTVRRHRGPEYLFRWKDQTQAREAFNRARKSLGMDLDDGRTMHTLRASAIDLWENEYLWDEQTRIDLAGHTAEVNRSHYRVTPSAEALERRIEHQNDQRTANVPADELD